MFKSESMDGDTGVGVDSLGLGDLRKPRLFRRSVTVPSEILSSVHSPIDDHKLLDLVCFSFLSVIFNNSLVMSRLEFVLC